MKYPDYFWISSNKSLRIKFQTNCLQTTVKKPLIYQRMWSTWLKFEVSVWVKTTTHQYQCTKCPNIILYPQIHSLVSSLQKSLDNIEWKILILGRKKVFGSSSKYVVSRSTRRNRGILYIIMLVVETSCTCIWTAKDAVRL